MLDLPVTVHWGFSLDSDVMDIELGYTVIQDLALMGIEGHTSATYQRAQASEFDAGASIEDQLVGQWVDSFEEFVFHADGTGESSQGPFEWEVSGNELLMHVLGPDGPFVTMQWDFSLDGDVLDIALERVFFLPEEAVAWTYVRPASN